MRALNIAVVGAGPAGLSSALLLNRAGHRVKLFERFDEAQPVGSGLMLQPTGMAVLRDLGLVDRLLGLGRRIDRLQGDDAKSERTVLEVAYRNGEFGLGVHRAALFNVLFDAVAAADIPIETAVDVTTAVCKNRSVLLSASDGTEIGSFDVVVDASGAHSPLRDPAMAGAKRKPLPYGAFWATLDWCGDGFANDALQQRYDKARIMIGVLPIGRQHESGAEKAAFFWSLKPADADAVRRGGIDSWKKQVAGYWPETQPYLDQISDFDDLVLAQYGHHTLKTPHRGRVVHIGDSAHSTSPQLGQGANMALLDAKALAIAIDQSSTVEAAFARYAALRRWHIRLFQFLSLFLTPFYQSDGTLVPLARDTLVSSIAKVPPVPAVLASMVAGTLIDPLKPLGLSTKDVSRSIDQ